MTAPAKSKMVVVDLTDEYKRKLAETCAEIIEVLRNRTESPIEGFMVLDITRDALMREYGIESCDLSNLPTRMLQ